MPLACSSIRLELDHVRRNLGKTKWIYIGETERRGLGIFAARRFVKGELVLRDANGDYYDGAVNYRQVHALGLDLSRDCWDHWRWRA